MRMRGGVGVGVVVDRVYGWCVLSLCVVCRFGRGVGEQG